MGELLSFPDKFPKPHCGECENAALGMYGVHCLLFRYDVFDEREAEDCEAFERVLFNEPVQIIGHPSKQ